MTVDYYSETTYIDEMSGTYGCCYVNIQKERTIGFTLGKFVKLKGFFLNVNYTNSDKKRLRLWMD